AGDHRRVAGRAGVALAPGPAGLSDPDVQGPVRPGLQDDHHRVQHLRPAAVRGYGVPARGGHAVLARLDLRDLLDDDPALEPVAVPGARHAAYGEADQPADTAQPGGAVRALLLGARCVGADPAFR